MILIPIIVTIVIILTIGSVFYLSYLEDQQHETVIEAYRQYFIQLQKKLEEDRIKWEALVNSPEYKKALEEKK